VSWGILVGPLAFFYFYFLAWTIKTGAVPPTSLVESVVLATMVLRLGMVMSVGRLRRARISVIIDIFALDVLVVVAILVLYVLLRVPAYFSLLSSIVLAWPTCLLLVFPPYALYRFAARMLEGAGLSAIIPSAIGLFALLVLPAEVASIGAQVQGLSGVSRLLLQVLIGQARSSYLLPEITVTGFLLYLALTLYAITRGEADAHRLGPLVVAVAGSLVALGWSVLGSFFTDDVFLLFAVPGLAILGAVWWATRGR